MIKLKITMADGRSFKILDKQSRSIPEFTNVTLAPRGTELTWLILPGNIYLRIENIVSMEQIKDIEEPEEPTEENPEDVIEESLDLEIAAEKVEEAQVSEEPLKK